VAPLEAENHSESGCDRELNGSTRFERDLLTVRVVQGVIDANFTISMVCSLHGDLSLFTVSRIARLDQRLDHTG
jgi:hypothetical protein